MKENMSLNELILYVSKLEERIEELENKTINRSGVVLTGVNKAAMTYYDEKKRKIKELTSRGER